jgi:hypothetical protein
MSRMNKASTATFSFLGDTQMLLHILQGVKASENHCMTGMLDTH